MNDTAHNIACARRSACLPEDAADAYRYVLCDLRDNHKGARAAEIGRRRRMGVEGRAAVTGERSVWKKRVQEIIEGAIPKRVEVLQIPLDYGLREDNQRLLIGGHNFSRAELVVLGERCIAQEQENARQRKIESEHAARMKKMRARSSIEAADGFGAGLEALMDSRYYVLGCVKDEERILTEPPKYRQYKTGVPVADLSSEVGVDHTVINAFRKGRVPLKPATAGRHREKLMEILEALKATPDETKDILNGYDAAVQKAQQNAMAR